LLLGDRLYLTSANQATLTILDAKTGAVVAEGFRLGQLGTLYASPMAAADRIYYVDRQGMAAVLKAGDKPEVLAVNQLEDSIDASPVALGKTLYLRGEKHLYAIEEK
jgi:hypothetical protein